MNRRAVLLALASVPAAPRLVRAQAWPARPLRLILPTPPGGAFDSTARLLQAPLAEIIGQPVVVENRSGGNGVPAMEAVLRANDGHSFALIGSSHAANATLIPGLPFDPVAGVAPVTLLARWPNVISVHPSQPFRTLAELLDSARTRPGGLSYATPGIGLSQHLAGELLKLRAGVDITHVPYRGAGPALSDAVAGHVGISITALASTAPHVLAGRLRGLAITGAARHRTLPEVPTVAEQGFPGFEVVEWIGIVGPASTPPDQRDRLSEALIRAIRTPAVAARLEEQAIETVAAGPAEFRDFLVAQVRDLGEIIRRAGIRAE